MSATGHSGPYLVTVKRPGHDIAKAVSCGGTGVLRVCECAMQSDMGENGGDCPYAVERVAVATLEVEPLGDVLRPLLRHSLKALQWVDMMNALTALPEAGGTVGPLPDGSTIRVEPVIWADLADRADCFPVPWSHERIIAAYNARQSA